MDSLSVTTYIAKCLKEQGIQVAFGIVGIPVTALAEAMQKEGIKFIAMRNEQAASYAASVYGYLTSVPAVCLTVSGPGLVHALAGLLNATSNCWPMLVLSSSTDSNHRSKGGFQEADQMESARVYSKYTFRVDNSEQIGRAIQNSLRNALYGKPGGVYLEIPRNVLEGTVTTPVPPKIPAPPRTCAPQEDVAAAVKLLLEAKKPLLVIGKGAAYARAEHELAKFVELTDIPFLPSPMGKGTLPDSHVNCVGPSRSLALAQADVLIIVGVRMNWMFDFAQKFDSKPKIIQLEIHAESCHTNTEAAATLCGDARLVLNQINESYQAVKEGVDVSAWTEWRTLLQKKVADNKKAIRPKYDDRSVPMKYHHVLGTIYDALPPNPIIVNEGANTMDIGRLVFFNEVPRSRLDAGTLGTMGVGVGYAIAAAVAFPDRKVVAVQGDSAFGFSAMEIEVACRYNLPITFIVLNNNGIYRGVSELTTPDPTTIPPTVLTPNIHYEKIMEAFGGLPLFVDHPDQLPEKVKQALESKVPSLLNIAIDPCGPIPGIVAGGKPATH